MKFIDEDKDGKKKFSQNSGTAQLLYKITDSIYVILTCAHNFVAFEKRVGKKEVVTTRVGDSDAYFFLQQDGEEKVAQFRMLKYFCYPTYERT